MSKASFFAVIALSLCSINALCQPIALNFLTGHWNDIVAQAKEEGKMIFVDVYADYCPPCKQMDAQVFTDKEVARIYNQNFINFKVNLSDRSNEYFQTLHSVRELPALLYFSPDGKVVRKESGCKDVIEFKKIGIEIAQPLSKNDGMVQVSDHSYSRLKQLERMYRNGSCLPETLREYAYKLKEFREPYNKIVNEYLATQVRQARTDANRKFVYDFVVNIENYAIDFFMKDIAYFKEVYGGTKANDKIKTAIYNSVLSAVEISNKDLFKKAESVAEKAALPDRDRFLFEMRSLYYQSTEDWQSYAKVADEYLTKKKVSDPFLLNDVAMKFQQYTNSKALLLKAVRWAKKSIEIESEYYNNATCALLWSKLRHFKRAKASAERAIEAAQKRGENHSTMLHFIDKIDNM